MMQTRFLGLLAFVAALTVLVAAPAQVQAQGYQIGSYTPGVDMPLFAVFPYRGSNTFVAGSVAANYTFVLLENTDHPTSSSQVETMVLSANGTSPAATAWPQPNPAGPVEYPQRPPRISYREVLTYNGIDWRNAQQNTSYTQIVCISWKAGVGRYTGQYYPAGSTMLALDYFVQ